MAAGDITPNLRRAPVFALDWRDKAHWSSRAGICRVCRLPTFLRDEAGTPFHKICAETERTTR